MISHAPARLACQKWLGQRQISLRVEGEESMSRKLVPVVAGLLLVVSGCSAEREQSEASAPSSTSPESEAPDTLDEAGTGEEGSGIYAADCDAQDEPYAISINTGGDGMVQAEVVHDGTTYPNLLTSYSFFGDETPADFLIAILFSEGNAPATAVDSDGARIEIWRGDTSYFALLNGDEANRLAFCPI